MLRSQFLLPLLLGEDLCLHVVSAEFSWTLSLLTTGIQASPCCLYCACHTWEDRVPLSF